MPLSPGQTSQVSTAPTEHSEDVGAGPVRQYRAAPFSASKQIEQHLGMRPVRTPLESYSLLKGLEEQGELPHPAVIARLSTSMARLGLADKVAELYQYAHAALTHQPDDKRLDAWFTVEDQMLMACCLLGRLEQAGAHRAAILEQNRVPSAESYALMISSAKDTTDDASVARELWEESQNLGVKPTLFLYNTVISKLSRARKAESALDFFKQMKAQGIRPSSVTYGAVINACCRVGDAESAATLFEEMQAIPNHKPRVPPYNTMMQLHLQSHPSRELVLHYYNQMVQANVAPSAHTYKLLLDAYGTLEPVDLGAMRTVFNNLCKDTSVSVTGTHWASMIHATGNVAGNAQEAIDMFESISTHPSNKKGGPIEPVCWEALMSVLAQHKMVAEMESYRAKMKEQGIKSTAYVYNMLIKGFANNGQIEDARAVFESMGDGEMGKAAPNNHPTLLTSSGQVKPATTADTTVVFREPSTYETMIRAELQAGDKDAARAICDRMEAR
ncbi:hypothetical protein FFLO_01922 [Filobasidium floriforme]|uniref:Pentacotripeptide-repeat region of PRORP domain-containing protein n=1 Tax=Filobasidium floriforme TaxID=5210 RepID=A0A8K0NSC1_9TREE|nr:uncharacterized protein HD553DRAFT_267376 [Filobasidium floriforme]KAG7562655.1 hypothetical protein FFLO_01922 [Filobasidium floriforme]KAH8089463.1 hypothetical protein HD553DRAFT_267376 [Filobasidium floriforme]